MISYRGYYYINSDLKVARCNDIACTSATTINVDTEGIVGWYTSITIGADGLPVISYFDRSSLDLKVSHCNDAPCTSATTTVVDSIGHTGSYATSITIGDDGLPVISYFDYTNQNLKVVHCNDVACTSATATVVDATGSVGWNNAITIGEDGLPVISYYDLTNRTLKVTHCSNPFCVPYFRRR